ncbi:MAG: hypothetical protein AB8F78_13845 [Saprospiraceae bacterium]
MGINERLRRGFSISAFALCLLGAAFSFGGCEQQSEGCLDFRALTVALDADDACTDCCTYPSLQLQFVPIRIGVDTFFSLRNTDTLVNGSVLGTEPELGFYLHEIFLIADDGERFEMQDTFTVFSGDGTANFLVESSVLRVSPFRQTSYTLGTLLEEKTFVAIEASLGLPDLLSSADVSLQPTTSPLYRGTDSLLLSTDNNYLDLAFKFEQSTGIRDSFELTDAMDQLVRWDLPVSLDYAPSYNLLITLGLPADNLLLINNGTVSGDVFVTQFLEEALVLEIGLSR